MNEVLKLNKNDIELCSDHLAKAFYDYPMFQHILRDKTSHENIKTVLSFLIKYSCHYAEAYTLSDNFEGLILFTDYKKYKIGFIKFLKSGGIALMKLGSDAGKRHTEFDRYTADIHKKIMKNENHQYIILLGVNPSKQGQGYGSRLMQYALKVAKEKGQSCYLETHGEKNVAFYEKLGFRVVSENVLPGTDFIQYAMLKD